MSTRPVVPADWMMFTSQLLLPAVDLVFCGSLLWQSPETSTNPMDPCITALPQEPALGNCPASLYPMPQHCPNRRDGASELCIATHAHISSQLHGFNLHRFEMG